MQRPCGQHVLRALGEQKEAQCVWGAERMELTFLFLQRHYEILLLLTKQDSEGTLGFSVHNLVKVFSGRRLLK